MSVLINMEMPKSCFDCAFMYGRKYCRANSKIEFNDPEYSELKGRYEGCPLTPVPEHGDLVDRDEMFAEFVVEGQKTTRYKIGERWELNGEEIRRVIARLPAVIPAEEGE